jgi:hypothetical protein
LFHQFFGHGATDALELCFEKRGQFRIVFDVVQQLPHDQIVDRFGVVFDFFRDRWYSITSSRENHAQGFVVFGTTLTGQGIRSTVQIRQ